MSSRDARSPNASRPQQSLNAKLGLGMVLALAVCCPITSQAMPENSYSIFGNPQCEEWVSMTADARFAWASGFLSILSMGHETSRRVGAQKFKNLEGIDQVIGVVNQYCLTHPKAQASEAAAPFLDP